MTDNPAAIESVPGGRHYPSMSASLPGMADFHFTRPGLVRLDPQAVGPNTPDHFLRIAVLLIIHRGELEKRSPTPF